ncbi:hypothetical protein WN55_01923 [Dufourea novaeangliae]|uniref:Uncharacterized protein n=1 Tax=Dufourea novaeangliae TaxID=178035 RepID=A0A154PGB3_DUFNO|nr:hypothetical protein WN55_01923 [Dufourea novaeangliae]
MVSVSEPLVLRGRVRTGRPVLCQEIVKTMYGHVAPSTYFRRVYTIESLCSVHNATKTFAWIVRVGYTTCREFFQRAVCLSADTRHGFIR